MTKFQNKKTASCTKCFCNFKENDVIATSTTTKRYCYRCATSINLVTGNLKIDLYNDVFVSDVTHNLESIRKNLKINNAVFDIAKLLVLTSIEKVNHISKNSMGVACAAIFLSCKIEKQHIEPNSLPVSKKTLEKNTSLLQKALISTDIATLSEKIHEAIR